MATRRATDNRAYTCEACHGRVKARRGQMLEECRQIHDAVCPRRNQH